MALIADAALKKVNPYGTMDVAVDLESKCLSVVGRRMLSVVGRRMQAAGQDTTPRPSPHSRESNDLSPLLA